MLHQDEQEERPARETQRKEERRFVAGAPLVRRHVRRITQRHGRHRYRCRHKPHAAPTRHHKRVDQRTLQQFIPVLNTRHKENTPRGGPRLRSKARRHRDQNLVGLKRFRRPYRQEIAHRGDVGDQVRQIGWMDGREHVDRPDNLDRNQLPVHLNDNRLIRLGLSAGIEVVGRYHGN